MGRSLRVSLCLWVCMALLVLELGCTVVGYENKPRPKPKHELKPPPPPPSSSSWDWDSMKMLWRQASAYFFPPNIDFRRSGSSASEVSVSVSEGDKSSENEDDDQHQMSGSGREKVKEAVAKSVEKGKTTVEESAKAAARTAQDLFKNTLSHHHHHPPEL